MANNPMVDFLRTVKTPWVSLPSKDFELVYSTAKGEPLQVSSHLKDFEVVYSTTMWGPTLTVVPWEQDTEQSSDEPEDSQTIGPSLELRQNIQAGRASAVVHAPPERAEKFLHFILPCDRAEDRIGDLEEKFHKVMLPRYGCRSAVRWYWVQVAFIAEERLRVWIGMSIGAIIAWLIGKIGS